MVFDGVTCALQDDGDATAGRDGMTARQLVQSGFVIPGAIWPPPYFRLGSGIPMNGIRSCEALCDGSCVECMLIRRKEVEETLANGEAADPVIPKAPTLTQLAEYNAKAQHAPWRSEMEETAGVVQVGIGIYGRVERLFFDDLTADGP